MPNAAKTHLENRFKVCLVCFQKGSSMQPIGEAALLRIQKLFLPEYNPADERVPAALCARCQRLLMEIDRGIKSIDCLPAPCTPIAIPKLTRSNPSCSCDICEIARSNPISEGLGKCQPRPHPVGRPPALDCADSLPPAGSVTTCQRCHSVVGRGIGHTCTITQRRENLCFQLGLDQRGAEIQASSTIKSKAASSTDNWGSFSSVTLATRGSDMTVKITPRASGEAAAGACGSGAIPAEEVGCFQRSLNLSRRQTKLAAQFIRSWYGRSSFEVNLEVRLRQLDDSLDKFFEVALVSFDVEDGACQQRPVVYCNNVSGLVENILVHRQVPTGNYLIKIGLDSGGSFLKVCLSIVTNTDQPSASGDSSKTQRPFHLHSAEGGVKNLLVIAIVEKAVESYDNLTTILNLLNLDELAFCMAVDMKMANALLGLQSCSSTFPCPWCETPRSQFANPNRVICLRTFGAIRANAALYQQAEQQHSGNSKPSAVAFKSCVRQPLLNMPERMLVIEAIPPMELHLLLGVVNKLFDELDNRLKTETQLRADDWAQRIGVQRAPYHGGQFNGNECERLLNSVDILQSMLQSNAVFSCMPIVRALRCFRAVKEKCFGMMLGSDYETAIREFGTAYGDLGINVTPKVHAVLDHVGEFLAVTNSSNLASVARGLGFWSEQSVESAHRDFGRLWNQCYKVSKLNPDYAERLRKCVVVYSSRHL